VPRSPSVTATSGCSGPRTASKISQAPAARGRARRWYDVGGRSSTSHWFSLRSRATPTRPHASPCASPVSEQGHWLTLVGVPRSAPAAAANSGPATVGGGADAQPGAKGNAGSAHNAAPMVRRLNYPRGDAGAPDRSLVPLGARDRQSGATSAGARTTARWRGHGPTTQRPRRNLRGFCVAVRGIPGALVARAVASAGPGRLLPRQPGSRAAWLRKVWRRPYRRNSTTRTSETSAPARDPTCRQDPIACSSTQPSRPRLRTPARNG
jgi:hypothetical protein